MAIGLAAVLNVEKRTFSEVRNGVGGVAEEVDGGELVPVVEAAAAVELSEREEQARSFARDSRAESTWRAYDRDFADF